MLLRTPVCLNPPTLLIRNVKPNRTPVVKGRVVVPVSDLLARDQLSQADIDSAVAVAGTAPELDPVWAETHANLLKTSCAYFANEVIRGPSKPPYNGKFLLGSHHLEWDELVHRHKKINILAARDHGKCRVSGSLVQAADGRRVPVERWCGGEVIAYDQDHYALVPAQATASQKVGRTRCFKVTTRTGRTETVADWHRFALVDGWIHAEDLKVGQRVAVPRTLPTKAANRWRSGLAWLLGLLVGDGGFLSSSLGLTADDAAVVDATVGVAASVGWELTGSEGQYRLTQRWVKADSPVEWIRDLGLIGVGSVEKHVPEEVFQLAAEEIAEFIAGWADADSHVNEHGGGSVELYTVSEQLARDGLHLLTRLGIVAVLAPKKGKYNGEDHWSWRLTIRGRSILRFARQVKLRGEKRRQLACLAEAQEVKDEGGSVDLLPKEVYDWLEHGKDWTRRRGGPGFERSYALTRDKAKTVSEVQGNRRLARLAAAEILWDEVTEIEEVGEHDVYAIQVSGYESYVGQDIINHNSFFWTMAYPIWRAGFTHPGCTIYIFSATNDLAKEFLKMVKEEMQTNPKLAFMIPYSGDARWTQTEIQTRQGSNIYARGFGVKVRGRHPEFIICDDVLTDESIYSETIRKRAIDYYLSAITNMLIPEGQIIVVGTPMHQGDLYHALKESGEYQHRTYPATNKEGKPLFPERYSISLLEAKKRELRSAARYAREFMCQPLTDEASLFPSKLFEGSDVRVPYNLGMGASYWEERECLLYTGVDIALSAEVGGDYFVVFTVAMDPQGNIWVANIRRHKGIGFQRQLDILKEEFYLMRPGVIHIEANQMQRVWSDEVVRTTNLPVRKFFTIGVGGRQPLNPWTKGATNVSVNKHHIDRGVPGLRLSLENRKWRIPIGDEHTQKLVNTWIAEMGMMGWIDGKVQTVGEHDDMVMACWMVKTAVDMGNPRMEFLEVRRGERVQPPLAAPEASKIVKQAQADGGLMQAEREALASIQTGQSVEVERSHYLARVRQAIHDYAGQCVDYGDHARAVVALEEIKRLDRLFEFRIGDYRPGMLPIKPAPKAPEEHSPVYSEPPGFMLSHPTRSG